MLLNRRTQGGPRTRAYAAHTDQTVCRGVCYDLQGRRDASAVKERRYASINRTGFSSIASQRVGSIWRPIRGPTSSACEWEEAPALGTHEPGRYKSIQHR